MIINIRIKNFRSIESAEISCGKITTFVGRNDAGKSNILRALNLFFNEETDPGYPFVFGRDFNQFATVPAKKAKEIVVELTIGLPDSYVRPEYPAEILWRKVWRSDGFQDLMYYKKYTDGNEFPPRSRVPAWLSKIKFDYVPAIKDRAFFVELQGKVYDVLASVAESDLRESAEKFENHIQAHLEMLAADVSTVFHDKSLVKLPENMRHVFEKLEFNSKGIPLSRRGDGIKVRHIPMILKFMAEKRNSLANNIKHMHIWGVEEPENNVEMASCFEMAEQFADYASQGIQIFLSTHSPVFYAQDYGTSVVDKKYRVQMGDAGSTVEPVMGGGLDQDMGLMPVVAPHVLAEKQKWEERISELNENNVRLKSLLEGTRPCLFCEGKSDELVLKRAIALLFPQAAPRVVINSGGAGYGGANATASRATAWNLNQKHSRNPVKAAALFDYDDAGRSAKKELQQELDKSRPAHAKCFFVKHPEFVRSVKSKGYVARVDLESIYPDSIWKEAEQKGWLADVQNLSATISNLKVAELSSVGMAPFSDLSDVETLRLRKVFSDTGKEKISRRVSGLSDAKASFAVADLKVTLLEVLRYLLPEMEFI